jgi:hypothetical protein
VQTAAAACPPARPCLPPHLDVVVAAVRTSTRRRPHARATAPSPNASRSAPGASLRPVRLCLSLHGQAGFHHAAPNASHVEWPRLRSPPHSTTSAPHASRDSRLCRESGFSAAKPGRWTPVWLPAACHWKLEVSGSAQKSQPATATPAASARGDPDTTQEVVHLAQPADTLDHQHSARGLASTCCRGK